MSKACKSLSEYIAPLFAAALLCAIAGCGSRQPPPQPLPPLDSVRIGSPTTEYRVQPGDVLRIKFAYHPEHDIRLPVRPDGKITLDIAGEIDAAGMTTDDLASVIKARSSHRLRDPEVTVIVAQLGEQKVYVGGEVRIPGFVPFRPGMTPMQAILDRGGPTDTARLDSVLYIRPAVQGDYQAMRLDLTEVVDHGVAEPVTLAANDVIYVPRSWVGDAGNFVQLYIRNLLPIQPRFGFAP